LECRRGRCGVDYGKSEDMRSGQEEGVSAAEVAVDESPVLERLSAVLNKKSVLLLECSVLICWWQVTMQ
jgi:hypothetical protein